MKTNLEPGHQFVNTQGSARLASTKVDVISRKGGYIDGTPRKRFAIIPPINHKGTEHAPVPTYIDGAGVVWGVLGALFLWSVGIGLIFICR